MTTTLSEFDDIQSNIDLHIQICELEILALINKKGGWVKTYDELKPEFDNDHKHLYRHAFQRLFNAGFIEIDSYKPDEETKATSTIKITEEGMDILSIAEVRLQNYGQYEVHHPELLSHAKSIIAIQI